jgi:hypothetical protein
MDENSIVLLALMTIIVIDGLRLPMLIIYIYSIALVLEGDDIFD